MYDRLDPIGKARDDFRMSYMESLITNLAIKVHGKKGASLTKVEDFMLDWGKEKEVKVQSVEEQKRILMDIFGKHNKAVERKSKRTNDKKA